MQKDWGDTLIFLYIKIKGGMPMKRYMFKTISKIVIFNFHGYNNCFYFNLLSYPS